MNSYKIPRFDSRGRIIAIGSSVRNRYDTRTDKVMYYTPKSGVFTGLEPFDERYLTWYDERKLTFGRAP